MKTLDQERWTQLWTALEVSADPFRWYKQLVGLYSEPQRHYHNCDHISDCLREFDSARQIAKQPLAIELAIWFHDAIYDPRAADNEERSAELALKCFSENDVDEEICDSVRRLIIATKHHTVTNHDSAIMIDVDLSIFGQDEKRFGEYEAQIRQEYAWVPDTTFAAKRAEILEKFLDRSRIYSTEHFARRYEENAQCNLANSIRKLKTLS